MVENVSQYKHLISVDIDILINFFCFRYLKYFQTDDMFLIHPQFSLHTVFFVFLKAVMSHNVHLILYKMG